MNQLIINVPYLREVANEFVTWSITTHNYVMTAEAFNR
jgi:hypothetical protein